MVGGGFIHAVDQVGCATAGLGTQAGCRVPFVRTNGGDLTFREFPHFVGRGRKWRLQGPILTNNAKFGLINDWRARYG